MTDAQHRRWATVAAATAFNLPIGSLYAFSVFLAPLEALLGVSRAELALVFAVASAGFGAGMNLAPHITGLGSARILVLACGLVSTAGIALAATAHGLVQLAVGYGALFGAGGGAGYIVVRQAVNLAVTGRRGLVNGYVVSLYPAGAMLAAPVFGWSIGVFGVRATLGGFAAVVAVSAVVAALLLAHSRVGLEQSVAAARHPTGRHLVFSQLWLVFFLAASAGLMVLSQAAGIIRAYGGAPQTAVYGTTLIAAAITAARIGGGWMVDRFAIPTVMAAAQALALAGNMTLTWWPSPLVAVLTLAVVGIGYGLISGSTAAAVAMYWRAADYGRVASRLYIAWCAAAIVLPIVAGRLFDLTGGYGTAVIIAGGGNAVGLLVAMGLPRQNTARRAGTPAASPGTASR